MQHLKQEDDGTFTTTRPVHLRFRVGGIGPADGRITLLLGDEEIVMLDGMLTPETALDYLDALLDPENQPSQ